MLWSDSFIPTQRETPVGTEAVSHQLLLRAGLVHMLTAGVYTYLPLGYRVLKRIEDIIREEMNAIGAQELLLPSLQPIELWEKTGRDEVLGEVMIRFEDQRGRRLCLGPTHEEVITELVKNFVQSYRQLPLILYQIQTKFRDETRPRFGMIRACEFIMKDAYSFDRDQEGLNRHYQLMYQAYQKIFKRCGLETIVAEADSGAMGGDLSHEFMVPAPIGEDTICRCSSCHHVVRSLPQDSDKRECPQCGKPHLENKLAIEIGHIFQLGTKYSQTQGAFFLNEFGEQKPMIMGCYGIGVSRLIAAIVETNYDAAGIIWPRQVAPYDVVISPLQMDDRHMMEVAHRLYQELGEDGWVVLLDDRLESPGVKFNDADLIGVPFRLTIGRRTLAEGKTEIKNRQTGEVSVVPLENARAKLKEFLKQDEF